MPIARPSTCSSYAPESLGWQKLLTDGSPAQIDDMGNHTSPDFDKYWDDYAWYNKAGAGMASFWVTLVFLMMIGFSYSYFWTASTQIYLLMRKRVDETELDEVYVEEEAPEAPAIPVTPAPAPTPRQRQLGRSRSRLIRRRLKQPEPTPSAPAHAAR